MIHFVDRSNELQNKKYGRSATGAERPILIPRNKLHPTAVAGAQTRYGDTGTKTVFNLE